MFIVCETFIKKYLPAIRASAAKNLMKKHSYNQLKISKSLGITQPAVSKILTKDFSTEINPKTLKQIENIGEEYSKQITQKTKTTIKLECICDNCKERAKDEIVCEINKER